MNSKLEQLFSQYDFSPKDKYDFMQIYTMLPNHKRVQTLENFESIASEILNLKQKISLEQQIMFGKTLATIEERILSRRKKQVSIQAQDEMRVLRNAI